MRQMFDDKQVSKLAEEVLKKYLPNIVMVYEANNIQAIGDDLCNKLRPGDIVRKITGKQKHTYMVSYKGDGAGEGICLTYCAAGYIETVSYDFVDGHWVYNSTDITVINQE